MYHALKNYFKFLLVLLGVQSMSGQHSVQYVHSNPLRFVLDDLNRVQIISNSDESIVQVNYQLVGQDKKTIVEYHFPNQTLRRGVNYLNPALGNPQWKNTPYRDLIQRNQLQSGNFQLCVEVIDVKELLPAVDDCFPIDLETVDLENPLGVQPIELESPGNKDTILEQRPLLTWIPPSPAPLGTQYALHLVEQRPNQSCLEAINNNIYIISKQDIQQTMLPYPAISPDLEKGKTYCWRVAAYLNGKEYTRSEDWEFVVKMENKKSTQYLLETFNHRTVNFNGEDLVFTLDNRKTESDILSSLFCNKNGKWLVVDKFNHQFNYQLNQIKIDQSNFDSSGMYKLVISGLNSNDYIVFIEKK